MNHSDHVRLIRGGVEGQVWADMGSGMGAFTLALADVLGKGGKIYSVDRDVHALSEQRNVMQERFPEAQVEYIESDMTSKLSNLPPLDGIVAANSIHFVKDRVGVLRHFASFLRKGGRLVVVEYNSDSGNMWVPHAFSFLTFEREAEEVGYGDIRPLETVPSQFLKEIYSAVAVK